MEAEEERVTVDQMDSDKAVDKNGGSTRGEGGVEKNNVSQVELGRPVWVSSVQQWK